MAFSHTVWSLESKQPLSSSHLTDETELERLILEHIEILNKNWLVIGNQVKTDAGKFIDILCVDCDGDLVVVELKKDMTPREVTAQVIDYAASVSKMSAESIAQIYLEYKNQSTDLNEGFEAKFGIPLNEENLNQHVKMVIVAAKMDDGTERIIRFLRETYQVDINILFFHIFQHGNERLISRVWFEEDVEEMLPPSDSSRKTWNGEYYASFGEGHRKWEDALKYGFISAGGGEWFSKALNMLTPGDRVWVNIPQNGYVGVGLVTEASKQAKDTFFDVQGQTMPMTQLSLMGDYFYSADEPEKAEWIVKVQWIKAVSASKAVWELGFFGNQNIVCRPQVQKWAFTVERLKKCWSISD